MAEWSKAVDLSLPSSELESLLQKCAWVRTPLVSFCLSFCIGWVFLGVGGGLEASFLRGCGVFGGGRRDMREARGTRHEGRRMPRGGVGKEGRSE